MAGAADAGAFFVAPCTPAGCAPACAVAPLLPALWRRNLKGFHFSRSRSIIILRISMSRCQPLAYSNSGSFFNASLFAPVTALFGAIGLCCCTGIATRWAASPNAPDRKRVHLRVQRRVRFARRIGALPAARTHSEYEQERAGDQGIGADHPDERKRASARIKQHDDAEHHR